MKHFTVYGEVVPKKNSRQWVEKLKRLVVSQRYLKWHKQAVEQLMIQKKGYHGDNVKLVMQFFHGDKRRRDSDNGVSSIFDTLVDTNIISDDNWNVIPKHYVENFYDKENPRCEIYIYDNDENVDFKF